jgi:hypothetical protein
MSPIEVRPFHRRDRDQLTDLVNAHAAAVVPGVGVSVAALLSHLEREPGEFIVDPFVTERATLVAEQNSRVAAAAHLLRYGDDESVAPAYRGGEEIRWLLFWPEGPISANPWWTAGTQAATDLIAACIAQLGRWNVTTQSAGGELPVPGVYGVPEQWPHVSALYQQAGFAHDGHTEVVYLARVTDLPRLPAPPLAGLEARRTVGLNGTRLAAVLDSEVIGYIEVEIRADGERLARQAGWADVGNLRVSERYRAPQGRDLACRPGSGLARAGPRRPAAGLQLPGRSRRQRADRRRLPGIPGGAAVHGDDQNQARLDTNDDPGPNRDASRQRVPVAKGTGGG